ncbi:GNAT family N-acetyltransferase [Cytophagaceae bacterium 50C-KIRBA]|uniref:GNAT family N-acetyltransferase n=1 Tax=Aquirufa beregesia TaxID=2516556 RepID=A0ABX0EWX4_9BACT|nr:GNAT family N-acetyltransferase [Aquirufa beregesia]NGZ43772.1 GNAT family N-acetyltransferase [Aquirufa beregesia]
MDREYRVLNKQVFTKDHFQIVPIRNMDQLDIMKWRNEQIYHLRQNKPLTELDQSHYFTRTIANLFNQEKPNQILFSYVENGKCLGYGGLVHINWVDRNAEISFIMDTQLEKEYFSHHWFTYLSLIEEVAFKELQLHKIYVYAFDLRPHLYTVLEHNGFIKEAELKEHCYFNDAYKSVIIHSKWNKL